MAQIVYDEDYDLDEPCLSCDKAYNVNIARAVNYNAVILKDALDRIAELERLLTPQESKEDKTIKRWE